MATRHGRRVPAHFGSTAAEEAVCQTGVGMADRSDRETFELRGTPEAIEQALVALDRALGVVHRSRPGGRAVRATGCGCARRARRRDGRTNRSPAYAAIGLIGPRAAELLNEVDLSPSGLIIREGRDSFEILLPAAHGPQLWDFLIEAGEPYELACVGHDALDRLAASEAR